MNDDILAYASVLRLTRSDMKSLQIKDAYSIHKTVYGLFEDVRSDIQKQMSESSGILWVDKGGDFHSRQILMLSNRKPHQTPQFGQVVTKSIMNSFGEYENYGFEITLNPTKRNKQTGKIEAIIGRDEITLWAFSRAKISWGFEINSGSLQVQINSVQSFQKGEQKVLHGSVHLKGELKVIDRQKFVQSFTQGIGRGKAFGFGLLQIVPLNN
jgi:CRISPR system Cascade subunit CasE